MTVEIASLLTELAGGRRPTWIQQALVEGTPDKGPPASLSDGVSCYVDGSGKSALVTSVAIQLRSNVASRLGSISVVYDNGATYSFALDGLTGTPVAYTAGPGEDEEDIVTGLAAALVAETNHNARLVGTAKLDGADSVLEIRGKNNPPTSYEWEDWVLGAISASGGGGSEEIAIVMDPAESAFFLWGLPAGIQANAQEPATPIESWFKVGASPVGFRTPIDVDWQGFVDTFNTGSLARLYVEIDTTATAGPAGEFSSTDTSYLPPQIFIGPASRESARSGV